MLFSCCHGNGVCDSERTGLCSCDVTHTAKSGCIDKTHFVIQNLWSSDLSNRFIYETTLKGLKDIQKEEELHLNVKTQAQGFSNNIVKAFLRIHADVELSGDINSEFSWFLTKSVEKEDYLSYCIITDPIQSDFDNKTYSDDELFLMLWNSSKINQDFPFCSESNLYDFDYLSSKENIDGAQRIIQIKSAAQLTKCAETSGNETKIRDFFKEPAHSLKPGYSWALSSFNNTSCENVITSLNYKTVLDFVFEEDEHYILEEVVTEQNETCQEIDLFNLNSLICKQFCRSRSIHSQEIRLSIEDHVTDLTQSYALSFCLESTTNSTLAEVLSETKERSPYFK